MTPNFYRRKYWIDFANKNNCNFHIFSYKKRQNNKTTTCGVWCLMFLLQKATKINFIKELETHSTLKTTYNRKCKTSISNNQKCCNFINIKKKCC